MKTEKYAEHKNTLKVMKIILFKLKFDRNIVVSQIVLNKSEQSLEYNRMPEEQYSPNLRRVNT